MTLLAISNLSIAFGTTEVVRDVSLTLDKGEILALVGESGSGKSLTAQSILKLLPAGATTRGAIHFDDSNMLEIPQKQVEALRGNRVGMIFQEPMAALNPLHTIDRQMIEPFCWHRRISMRHPDARARLAKLFAMVGLTHLRDRGAVYPHQLSGGERQRAMIAMAMACEPDLLIADEPTTALDVTLQNQILQLLKDLQKSRNMGMLFITHDLLTVRRIADRVAVMQQGRIVEEGTVNAVFDTPQHAYTKMLLAAAPQGTARPIAADAPIIIKTDKLCVRFPIKGGLLRRTTRVVEAVKNASLTLHAGETLGVVGESGSGKSSLGYALLRLIKSEGPILFMGNRIDQLSQAEFRPLRRSLQLVFQDPYGSLNPRMTVGDIVAEGLKLHSASLGVRSASESRSGRGQERSDEGGALCPPKPLGVGASPSSITELVTEILTAVGLAPEMQRRYPHEFSGGQRQRIAIARAMILKPKLVVLDEPTSALDMSVQHQVLGLLRDLQKTHDVAYVFISHDLRVIRAMAHQVLVMQKGVVVEQGPTERLFTAPSHPYTQTLLAAALG